MTEKIGWTAGHSFDGYTFMMKAAADFENRAAVLECAMESIEAELGSAAIAPDAGLRAAAWVDKLRAASRQFRDDAIAMYRGPAREVKP